jgi:trimethylamine--corrinoid protein Co-methyltransferase
MRNTVLQPDLHLLSEELATRVLDEAFQLLLEHGVRVDSPEALALLAAAGAQVDSAQSIAKLPEKILRQALASAPSTFSLFDLAGRPTIHYGGRSVHFDPGSSGVYVLDPETGDHRPAVTTDLIRLLKTAEQLPQFAAQSTAVVCADVPEQIGDLYRLYIVLLYSTKPIVTGAFSTETTQVMIDMLAVFAGGRQELAARPRAVFDVCPSPPLIWSEFASRNLIDLGRAGVPVQIVSMPLAGAAAPVTLLGAIVQHSAECLSGITIHQLAAPGAPVVWGGAPAIFDMRQGTTPMGAIETAMIDIGYAQIGQSLNLPTHTYLGASDAKLVDAQAGLESGLSATLAALAGINMISGAGMLDFLACQSAEKLAIDAEAIAMAQRLCSGFQIHTGTLALEFFTGIGFKADFLKQKSTRQLFAREQYLPSEIIDRGSIRSWEQSGRPSAYDRARVRVKELIQKYQRPSLDPAQEQELVRIVDLQAEQAGMFRLPDLS